jgi:RHS repeat-associated protein
VTLHATPSALSGYSVSGGTITPTYKSSAGQYNVGLVHVHTYYSATTTDLGGSAVEGYKEYDKIKQGRDGTAINVRKYEYSERSATRVERFDEFGRLEWTKDERGVISYKEYDLASGNVTKAIEDVDDTTLTLPTGWSTPTGGGKHLVTDFEYDSFDRLVQTLGPAHDCSGTTVRTASWTVHKTADRETRSAQGYAVSDGQGGYICTLANPVQIEKRNATGTRSESISATRASSSGKLTASDTFAQSSYIRWSVNLSNDAGQLTATRAYHTIPTSGDGSSGTNYDESTFAYDAMGRQNKSVTPGGTISRTVFDARGHALADYVGTDDSSATDADPTGAGGDPHLVVCTSGASSSSSPSSSSGTPDPNNNMVLVAEREYCDGSSGCSCGGGGAGNLVSETRHVDFLTWHTTDFEYDWRGRQLHVFPPADDAGRTVYTKATYDNLDRATKQERYLEISGSADRLLARSETFYDDRGRVYQTKRYAVDVDSGTVGNALVSNTWFDAAGNAIKQQSAGSQAFTKTVYDSLGWAVKQYVGHDTDETAYADASSVSDDTIVEQVETVYDDAGNVLQTTTRQRFHNATGTGELTSPSGVQPKARVTYAAMYHDEVGRQIAVANYGTYGGATFSRASVVPNRTDTILVTSTDYNVAGQAYKTIDPAGREDRQVFDDAGRVVKTIQNYIDGVVSAAASDEDVTVEMTYNADGNLSTLTAKNPTTGDQVTTYVYGTTLSDSEIATSTLKRAEIYPDSDDTTALGDGTDGVYDRIEFKYDRQQRVTEVKDQQETVHAFDFDALGRQTQDRVTTLGSGVDNAVRRISTTYDVMGRREKISSCDNPAVGSGSIVNEVQFAYDDFGQLVTEYQEHGGAVNTTTSLKVQYAYEDGTDNNVRLAKMTYPDGRELNYSYGSAGSTDDALSRVASLIDNDGTTHLVDYSYVGRNTSVKTDYPEPDLRYDLAMGAGSDPYDGFDRFGRVVDSRWYDYGSSADVDRIKYGYDRAGNRTFREQTCDPTSHHDEVYAYDGVNRLADFDRGTINANKDAISTLKFAQQWSLDPTGNWSGFKEDDDGDSSWDLNQSRTSNEVNEITNITETCGPSWATPAYNRAGNMTTIPKPADPTSSFAATYDAWNRLVKLENGWDAVSEYAYDGAKRRGVQKTYDSGELDQTRHFYYTDPQKWQVIDERLESSGEISANADRQFVWGLRHIDDFVLRDRDTDSNGSLDERLYALQDANWNVTAVADTSGDVQERYAYSAYGAPRVLTPAFTVRASSSYDTEVLYAGYRHEEATGLYHTRRRVYQPELGCWVQRDPIAFEARDPNFYRYVHGQPIHAVDPFGLYEYRMQGQGDACNESERDCIDKVIGALRARLEKAVTDDEDCFTPRTRLQHRGVDRRARSKKAIACNRALARCFADTVNAPIQIGCHSGGNKLGKAKGQCLETKALAVPRSHRKGLPTEFCTYGADPTCDACAPEILSESQISFRRDRIPPPNRCDLSRRNDLQLREFFRTVMHEVLHNCVGPHLKSDYFCELGRCDAENLTNYFAANCG